MAFKKQLYLRATLLESSEEYAEFSILIPVTRMWFEDVNNDLHIQFTGHEDRNICPHHNSHQGEIEVPKDALKFRAWLKAEGGPKTTRIHFDTCMFEVLKPTKSSGVLPEDVAADLINNWHSPNGPFL